MKTKMKTTLLLLLFLVAHADDPGETDQGFKLKCSEETVEVQVGQNVTLNCKSEPQQDLTGDTISWKFNEKLVLNFRDRKMSVHQDEQFKGRVHRLSDWNVSEGKLSVEISSVNERDTGNYTCSVLGGPTCTVTLIVDRKSTEKPGAQNNTTTRSGDSNTGAITGTVAGVGVIAVIGALVTGLIYRNRKSRLSCKGTQRGAPVPTQDNPNDMELNDLTNAAGNGEK